MALRDIQLNLSYNSGENNLSKEFYTPCLKESIRYDRAAGYFTSGVLGVIASGINMFLLNQGTMRLVCSPRLTKEDAEAIKKGYENRKDILEKALIVEIDKIPEGIINNSLNCLSWLIANNKLDIKIALPDMIDSENYGIYHEKMGIFYDSNDNVVAFSGSQNETMSGMSYNYESFDVYRSWVESERCRMKQQHFNDLWENQAKGVDIMTFPEAAKKRIIERVKPQRYKKVKDHYEYVSLEKKKSPETFLEELWYFQKEAIDNWKDNNYQGILSMATGTGKTKTAIGGIIKLKQAKERIFAVIVCPQNSILKQWQREIEEIDLFDAAVVADSTNKKWGNELANNVLDFNNDSVNSCVVYTTYNTFSGDKFRKIISDIEKNAVVICDEVHWSGAYTFSKGLLSQYSGRLGLSATPKRYMDEEGTDEVEVFFKKVVFEFPLSRALEEKNPVTNKTFLCPYKYYPIFVELDSEEIEEYYKVSEQISRQYAQEHGKEEKISEYLQRLYEKRQAIVVNATRKYESVQGLLDEKSDVSFALFYCSPQQIDDVQDILNERSIINHRFTGEEETNPRERYNNLSERDYILDNFEKGNYNALVAMKCLDEGINVLRAETGIFLASSGNPKQFIQRRGRLLRRHENKDIAYIYDFFVVPYLDEKRAKQSDKTLRKLLKNEFKRSEEFADLAENRQEAKNMLFKIKELYDFDW